MRITRSARKRVAVEIMRRLNILPTYIRQFQLHDKVGRSENPYGFVYSVKNEEQAVIDQLESDEGITIFAVIHSIVKFDPDPAEEQFDMHTYLFVSDEDVHTFRENITAGRDALDGIIREVQDGGIGLEGYVITSDKQPGEAGYVEVKGIHGGLRRLY